MGVRHKFSDALLLEATDANEAMMASLRVFIYGLISLLPFSLYFLFSDTRVEVLIILLATIAGFVLAITIFILVKQQIRFPGRVWLIIFCDISIITLVLLVLAMYSSPLVAANSLVIWQLYGIIIFATSLRLNPKITISTGLLCVVQYIALLSYLAYHTNLTEQGLFSEEYGGFRWATQVGRIMMLLLLTTVATGFAMRCRKLVIFSGTDSLTGLKNRAYFEHTFSESVKVACKKNQSLTIVFLDLDYFKTINDKYGHAIGDLALQKVADVLVKHADKETRVARWGGEEFVLLFPNVSSQMASDKLNTIRETLKQGLQLTDDIRLKLELSAGLVECPKESADPFELINIADDRMLQAKRAGRDQVVRA